MDIISLKGAVRHCCSKGNVTLTSGKQSNFYIDIKSLMLNSIYLYEMAAQMHSKICEVWGTHNVIAIGGMELGSIPLATAINIHDLCMADTGMPTINTHQVCRQFIVRKQKRMHGTASQIEGLATIKNQNVVLVDDVLTTGGSLITTVNAIAPYANIVGAIVVVDRQDVDKASLCLDTHALFTKKELI